MKPCAALFGATLLFSAICQAAAFDVATIKPSQAPGGGNQVGMTADTLTMNNVTLSICIKFAYDLQDGQIVGPESLRLDRFDIVAKAATPFTDQGQVKAMLQMLLTERFHMTIHRETRDQTVFALVVTKGGPKFQKSVGEGKSNLMGKQTVIAQRIPMPMFAQFLSGPMGKPVTDMTGLEGVYDFKLDLTSFLPTDLAPGREPDVASMVLSALPEQLGLRLEARKMPVEMLVIDYVEPPTAN